MSSQLTRRGAALVSLLCALITPAVAAASRPRAGADATTTGTTTTGTTTTGGTGFGGTGTGTTGGGGTGSAPSSPAPSAGVVPFTLGKLSWAAADGITLGVTGSALAGGAVTFSGTAPASALGDTVLIRYAAPAAQGGSIQVAQTIVGAGGSFTATWLATTRGLLTFTVTLVPTGAVPTTDPPTAAVTVQVLTAALATIYGPGLWGRRTACGQRLRRATLGVASRTLRCGTEVAVAYGQREMLVPVIDRGPFHSRAKWDLTEATARALGVQETATVRTIEPWPQSQQLSALS